MGTVIYSASPTQAFFGASGTILFLFGLGIVGIAVAIFQHGQRRGGRIGLALAGSFLVLVSVAYAAVTLLSAAGPTHSVMLNLNNKQIAQDNCDNGRTCTRFVLEGATGGTAYDFNVPREIYDRAQVNVCYQFTYYPTNALFSNNTVSYQMINNVARIETADPSRCK